MVKSYLKSELEEKSFADLRKIGYKLGTKGRSKDELIKEILELQKPKDIDLDKEELIEKGKKWNLNVPAMRRADKATLKKTIKEIEDFMR